MARTFSVTSHDIGDPNALCFSMCFLGPGVCGLASMACSVQLTCVCVYLKRAETLVSDLHYWRRTGVACLTTLCEMLVL